MNEATATAEAPDVTIEELQEAREKILHLLSIYPVISPTMLQSGLGPTAKPAIWRVALEQLKDEKLVTEYYESRSTIHGRHNTYTKLSLTVNVVERA